MPDLPTHDMLGPDPEPPGGRAAGLVATAVPRGPAVLVRGPVVCPLAQAIGHEDACALASCPFYRAPGTVRTCAVEEWAPFTRRHPELARWFLARRAEIERGRAVPAHR